MTPEDSDTLRLGIRKFRGSSLSLFISSTSSLDVCIEPISGEGRCENKPADRFVLEASSSLPSGSAGAAVCVVCGGQLCVCVCGVCGGGCVCSFLVETKHFDKIHKMLATGKLSNSPSPYHMTYSPYHMTYSPYHMTY